MYEWPRVHSNVKFKHLKNSKKLITIFLIKINVIFTGLFACLPVTALTILSSNVCDLDLGVIHD